MAFLTSLVHIMVEQNQIYTLVYCPRYTPTSLPDFDRIAKNALVGATVGTRNGDHTRPKPQWSSLRDDIVSETN